ncbi:MAG: thiolase family protein [Bacillota bacterium]|nr:thiolase family protein [Bacillota bacterium]
MREAVIVAYGRSPICRAFKGSLVETHPVDYAAQVMKGVLQQIPQLDLKDVEDVIVGCAVQHKKTSMNVAKNIVERADLPQCVAAQSINRFCSSGLQAIATASNAIIAGQGDVYIAGGVEDMTGTFEPYSEEDQEPWLRENKPGAYMPMGITAENVAADRKISRQEMDEFAVTSHKKAAKAQKTGQLAYSIIPVTVKGVDGEDIVLTTDEGIRENTNVNKLAELKPSFTDNGTVTAATSSQTSDAAAFVVLMERSKAVALGIEPIAKLISYAIAGCDATKMGLGPVYAVPKVMARAGLTVEDMDVIEINEAFAAQAIPCCRELGFPMDKVNPYGGAIALGHPLGATGAILTCKALDYLKVNNGKYGLITMCIGGGMGAAGIIESL